MVGLSAGGGAYLRKVFKINIVKWALAGGGCLALVGGGCVMGFTVYMGIMFILLSTSLHGYNIHSVVNKFFIRNIFVRNKRLESSSN